MSSAAALALDARIARAEGVAAGRTAVAEARERARARVCTGSRHPGRPEDYAYTVSERCVPRSEAAKKRAAAAAAERRGTQVMTRVEAKRDAKVLDAYIRSKGSALRRLDKARASVHPADAAQAVQAGHLLGSRDAVRRFPADMRARYEHVVEGMRLKDPDSLPEVVALLTHKSYLAHVLGVTLGSPAAPAR
jgi:hypothetical protein